jgi:protoporphyrinogen oxidase
VTEDVVIVGAGPAGLTAAHELSRHGVTTTVIERDPVYVGGLARTVRHNGSRFDIGGHRFFTKIPEVQQLWHELLPDDMLTRPRLSRVHYRGRFFQYPLRATEVLSKLELSESARIIASYLYSRLRPIRPETNFEQWVTNRFGRHLYEMFFRTYTEKVWGIPCHEIGSEWAAQRIKDLSVSSLIRNALRLDGGRNIRSLVNEFEYPRLGPGQMWERCRDVVVSRGHRVSMGTDLATVHHRAGRVTGVTLRTENGETERLPARHLLSSMPLRELICRLDPPPPAAVLEAAGRLRYRDFLTVNLILERPDLFPDNWIYVHSPEVRVGRIQNFGNWSRDMLDDEGRSALGLEYFVFEDDDLWSQPDDALLALGLREIEQLGLASGRDVHDGCVVRVRKAYPVYDRTVIESVATVRRYVEAALGGLQQIGRNGQHRYNNQDHSMATALRAARNVLGERHDVWDVNEHAEYHETQDRAQPRRITALSQPA